MEETTSNNVRTKKPSTRAPKIITPRLLSVLRRLASGQDPDIICKEYEFSRPYLNRCLREPHIKAEYDRLTKLVEQEFVVQATGAQASPQGAMSTAITTEVDASILESIQKLRHIMNTSPSHQAQALAAKELLDLGQAKKRLALLDKGLEDGVEVSTDDIALLATTVKDLRLLHMTNLGKDSRATVERRFAATEEEIQQTLPDEMLAAGVPANEATIALDPILGEGQPTVPGTGERGPNLQGLSQPTVPSEAAYSGVPEASSPVLPAPVTGIAEPDKPAPVIGPTIEDMLNEKA